MAYPTRRVVGITSTNTAVFQIGPNFPLIANQILSFNLNVDSLTSDEDIDFAYTAPPGLSPADFIHSYSGFVNMLGFTNFAGIEMRIDLSIDGSGNVPNWRNALTVPLVPGVLGIIDAFRVNQMFARASFANTTGGTVFLTEVGIKLTTL
jgi:hypothetical protein